MSRRKRSHVVCLSNEGYRTSLEPRKIYVALADPDAERDGLVRIVDESGEDYLYPRKRFAPIELPRRIAKAFSPTT